MKASLIGKAYAKAIFELGDEINLDTSKELESFECLVSSSNDLENLLFLDIFSIQEKISVLNDLFARIKTNSIIQNFILFLVRESRINLLPIIYKELIVLDDEKKGFVRGMAFGPSSEAPQELMTALKDFLKKELGQNIHLSYAQDATIAGGVRVKVEDLMFDATIESYLANIKRFILEDHQ